MILVNPGEMYGSCNCFIVKNAKIPYLNLQKQGFNF